jgi:hypothetical protein
MILIRLSVSQNDGWSRRLFYLKRTVLVSITLLFLTSVALAQFKPSSPARDLLNQPNTAAEGTSDLAIRSIEALQRLEKLVPVYTSRGAFEVNPRLSSAPFEVFKKEFKSVLEEIEPLLCRLPQGTLKMQIVNALYAYRDGVFWWGRLHQPRTVNVSFLSFAEVAPTPSDAAHAATLPYTVAIHWRQASKHLKRAEQLSSPEN